MSKILLVAWREFKHTALTKAFIFGAIIFPLIIMAVMVIAPILFRPNVTSLTGTISIVDADGHVATAAEHEFSDQRMDERVRDMQRSVTDRVGNVPGMEQAASMMPRVKLSVKRADAGEIESLKKEVSESRLDALAIYPAELNDANQSGDAVAPTIRLYTRPSISPNHLELIRDALRDAVVKARVEEAGEDVARLRDLLARPRIQTRSIDAGGGEVTDSTDFKRFIPIAFMILVWVSTFVSANYLLTSTIEEKSNKVIEVLLSAVSPMQLMTGKILGQALVSVIMLVMYSGLGIAALVYFALFAQIPPIYFVYTAVYFVMGYFMIAAMMAGIGSAVSELREAQSLIGPAMMVLMIPMMLWFFIQENPNGPLATVTSFIPPLIPFVMILRVTSPAEAVPVWQIVASIVWGGICMVGMVWMAARIFRVGVLMYGKPPSPLELLKWVRYS
ncbi:MAG: ABC transporter permease [Phycisphaerales bacterium]